MKRFWDLGASLVALVMASPVLLALAVLIKLSSPGPVFYRGARVGKGGRTFRIWKFRTMVVDADRIGGPSTADDDPRVTCAGRFLRRYKLDELPQLLNVLAGEMSLVGPRPEVPQEVALYTEEERGLLNVLPGITDWASLCFHNEGEILKGTADPHQAYRERIRPEKIRLSLEYVRNHSAWIDMKIIVATALTLAGRFVSGPRFIGATSRDPGIGSGIAPPRYHRDGATLGEGKENFLNTCDRPR